MSSHQIYQIRNIRKYQGMSLLEILVYVAVFGLVFLSVVQFLMMMVESNRVSQARIELATQKTFIFQTISSSFAKADSIDTINSIFNETASTIVVVDSGISIQIAVDNGRLRIRENLGAWSYISPEDITVERFSASPVSLSDDSVVAVFVELEITSSRYANFNEQLEHTFYLK